MQKQFCPYCGLPLGNCDCERQAEEEHAEFIETYESDPEVCYGWYQQDIIDMRRREQ